MTDRHHDWRVFVETTRRLSDQRTRTHQIRVRQRDHDRHRRIVLELEHRVVATALTRRRPDALNDVTTGNTHARLEHRRTLDQALTHGHLARGAIPTIVGGHEPAHRRRSVVAHEVAPRRDRGAPRRTEHTGQSSRDRRARRAPPPPSQFRSDGVDPSSDRVPHGPSDPRDTPPPPAR